MRMLETLLQQFQSWRPAMPRERSHKALRDLMIGLMANGSKRSTLTAAFHERGGDRDQKGAFSSRCYHVLERAKTWVAEDLFKPVLGLCLDQVSDFVRESEPVVIAMDDTTLSKAGQRIEEAGYHRDPMGPKFRVNFKWGIRCVHAAFILPFQEVVGRAWAVTVAFDVAPPAKKPTRSELKPMTPEEQEQAWADFKVAQQECSLTTKANAVIARLRGWLDDLGQKNRRMLLVVDGSYTNKKIIQALPGRVDLVGRCRKQSKLRLPYEGNRGNRFYGEPLTPEDIFKDHATYPIQAVQMIYGGVVNTIRFKDARRVYWKDGTGRRPMRALVVMPIPYRARNGQVYYNKTAYLLSTDLTSPAEYLVRQYLARWEIEVLHRDMKREGLGVGDPQCWRPHTVRRIHTAFAAAYAMLNLAILRTHGPKRDAAIYGLHDPWRNDGANRTRPSHMDKVALLRRELDEAGFWDGTPRKRRRKPPIPLRQAAA